MKTPEQLKAWREKDWKPLGYRKIWGYLYDLPVYQDDYEGRLLAIRAAAASSTIDLPTQADIDAWIAKQESKQ